MTFDFYTCRSSGRARKSWINGSHTSQRSQDWLADSEKNAIHNYRNLVITTATNACHDYLRAKSPNRARLKNKLRELCARHRDFKIWQGASHEPVCGFSAWEGEAKSKTATEQIRRDRVKTYGSLTLERDFENRIRAFRRDFQQVQASSGFVSASPSRANLVGVLKTAKKRIR